MSKDVRTISTKKINGRSRPNCDFPVKQIICLGFGKSAGFYAAATPSQTPFLIITDHANLRVTAFRNMWDEAEIHPLSQSDNVASLHQIVKSASNDEVILFIATTYPERFGEWCKRITSDSNLMKLMLEKKQHILFYLPHSPNHAADNFLKNFTVIRCDYYQGIGGIGLNSNGIFEVTAGTKEKILLAEENIEQLAGRGKIDEILRHLTLNQEVRHGYSAEQIDLLPTNAILHLAGITAHVTEVLVEKNILSREILDAKSSQEFFVQLRSGLRNNSQIQERGIFRVVGDSLKNKGFYRQMPEVGPNILMDEISTVIDETRRKLIQKGKLQPSDLDHIQSDGRSAAHIFHHLHSKYSNTYAAQNRPNSPEWFGFDGASEMQDIKMNFAHFVNHNPPYQNPQITVPTNPDGTLNVGHRFFIEEIPTLRGILKLAKEYKIPEEKLSAVKDVIDFIDDLTKDTMRSRSTAKQTAQQLSTPKLRSKL